MAVVGGQLVGRTDELACLDDLLARVERGRSAALAVTGEPGIGKTRLLAELGRRADARRLLVLSGCGAELQTDLPFWVFVDALDEYVQGLDDGPLEGLDDETRAELAQVLPSLAGSAPGRPATLRDERYRAHHAVRRLLEVFAARKPLVLALDDLHWADAASVELLGALLRRPPAASVLIALALRPRQAPARLAGALEREHRAGALARIGLEPLSRAESEELLGAGVGVATAERLHDESGGNPFYLEQLARSLERAPASAPDPLGVRLGGVPVPETVAAALAEELGLLSRRTRRVVEGASVVGDVFEPELAAVAASSTEAEAAKALDELLRADLVRHTDVPRRFRFRHPLVRRAVYDATPGGGRLGAHERVAAALGKRGAPAAACAHHVERSARQGDAAAITLLRAAARESANRAPASSARWLGAALRLLPQTAPASERVELQLAYAGALAASGGYAQAHGVLLEGQALLPEGAIGLRVNLAAACAGVEHLLGRHEDAHARLHAALAGLENHASPEAVALMLELATDGFYRIDYGAMRTWAGRALEAARPLGLRPLTAAAVATLAFACALDCAIVAGQAHRAEAATLVDSMSDDELALRLDAAVSLGGAELYLDRFHEAETHLERAIAVARATGQTDVVPISFSVLGWVRMVLGQLSEGARMLDGAVEGARLSGHAQTLALHLLNRSLTALAAGDLETALMAGQESFDLTAAMDQSLITAATGLALGAALLEVGDPGRAAAAIVGRCGGEGLPLMPGSFRAKWLELLTRCLLALGRADDATRAAAAAEARADLVGLPMARALAQRARAAVVLDAGDPGAAAEIAQASAAYAEEAGAVVEAALSRILAGQALVRCGERDRAVVELERAAADLDACGAVRYRREAERELRRLGRRLRGRSRSGAGGTGPASVLTDRELGIARLVIERRSNAEIAAELFLSRKTVETHISNILRKLGVSSRVEIAHVLGENGAPGPSRGPSRR